MWFLLLACGGGDAEAPAEAVASAPVAVDSPFCASFEACLEGLPGWAAECDRWWAGDPDCSDLDFSAGPADWYDETSRGIAALRNPGTEAEAVVLEELFVEPAPQKEPPKTTAPTKGEGKGERK